MPAPLLRRRWFRVLLGVTAAAIVLPTLVYALGGPGAREAIDGFWRWFDGSLQRLQVMSWVVAAVVAVVSYLDYLSSQTAQQLEQARWVADKAASGDEQQRRVASRAISDMEEDARARGEQVPSFVEEVKDSIRSEMIDAVVADDEAVQELRGEGDDQGGPEPGAIDGAPHRRR